MSKNIKDDFPIFKKAKVKSPFIYLDSTATSQKPASVIAAIVGWYEGYNANIHRGVYELSEKATQKYEAARQVIADFIGAQANEVIFTRGTTEGINLVAGAWARRNLRAEDTVLLTEMEHHANIVPWQRLAKEKGIKLKYWPINDKGELILSDTRSHNVSETAQREGTLLQSRSNLPEDTSLHSLSKLGGEIPPASPLLDKGEIPPAFPPLDKGEIPPAFPPLDKEISVSFPPLDKGGIKGGYDELFKGVKLLSLVHVSNVLGTINPVAEIIKQAHRRNIPVLLDAAQSVPHFPVNVKKLDCDFLAFSGHKMLAPTGIGVLYVKPERFKEMDVYQTGGDMIKQVTYRTSTFASPPTKFEAGTQPMAGVIGLAAAVEYLQALGMDKVAKHDEMIVAYALEEMIKLPEVTIYGPLTHNRSGAVAFTVAGIHAHDLATFFDEQGICIRAGHHCAQPLHDKLGIPASARVSFYIYNNKQEVDYFIEVLKKIIKDWRREVNK